jgi:hypothetical protein
VAVVVALLPSGCLGDSEADPPDDPGAVTYTSSPYTPTIGAAPTAVPTDSGSAEVGILRLALSNAWQPDPPPCRQGEVQVVQPQLLAGFVRLCRPSSRTVEGYLRLVNISETTLVFTVTAVREPARYFPSGETKLTQAALKVNALTSSYDASTGELVLPARFEAVVVDHWTMASVPVRNDATRGQQVTMTRVVSDLTAQLPYAKLGELPQTPAKVAACALESASKANDDEITVEEAMDAAETCSDLAKHLRQKWEESRAAEIAAQRAPRATSRPPAADDLLRSLSHGTQPVESKWGTFARFVRGASRAH